MPAVRKTWRLMVVGVLVGVGAEFESTYRRICESFRVVRRSVNRGSPNA
jgi:hypothetical protein